MNRKWISFTAAAALALFFSGCSKNQSQPTGQEPSAAANSAKKTVDMSTVGSISGVVKLDGTPPKFRPINMSADPYCVKANSKHVYPDEVVTGRGGTLANVVVYVKSGAEDYSFPTPTEPVTFDQKGCMYTPHVLAFMVGQQLQVINSDNTTHNIHPTPADNREWNKSQPPKAPAITETFARPEVAIPVKCNVHPWMKGYFAVMANPYYAVTAKDGKFELKNLPPGTYTIEAWQEKYGVVDQTVTVGNKESKTADFTFKASS